MELEAEPQNPGTPLVETARAAAAFGYVVAAGRSPRGVWLFVVTQLLSAILLQRIVLPGTEIEVIWVTLAIGLAVFWVFGEMRISRTRTILFLIFASSVCISVLLAANEPSILSVILLITCYSTYVLRINVTVSFYIRCMGLFVDVMVFFALLAIIQIGGQALTGVITIPSMDDLLPKTFIVQGYVYWQPLYWGSKLIKPPAFFFREVSALSQFLSIAIVAEIAFFRRPIRLLILLTAIFSAFAGTGLLVLALTSPFLVAKLPRKAKILSLPVLVCGAIIIATSGWVSTVESRFSEYHDDSSSSYGRFIYPILVLAKMKTFYDPFLTGLGAGIAEKEARTTASGILSPPTKLLLEYGILPTLLFYTFFLYCLFDRAPDTSLSLSLLFLHTTGGGSLLSSPDVVLILILGSMLRVENKVVSEEMKKGASRLWLTSLERRANPSKLRP